MDERQALGRRGEELAARHLEALGYKILERNLVNSVGEIDLVARDGRTMVLVEVKTRSKSGRPPSEAVDYRKQRKLTMTAALLLQKKNWQDRPCRFDVVEIISPSEGTPIIRHIKNAFDAAEY